MRQVKITKWDFELMPEGSAEEPAAAGPTGPTAGTSK